MIIAAIGMPDVLLIKAAAPLIKAAAPLINARRRAPDQRRAHS